MPGERSELVGPVLEGSEMGRALASVISRANPDVRIEDRGAYLRVLSPRRCVLTVRAVERELGRPFRLPVDLEALMPAFKGLMAISPGRVEWSFGEE